MILEYDGKTVNWFHDYFVNHPEHKKIGMWLSGGADSAFTLWWLCKCITDNNLKGYTIFCLHGRDTSRTENNSSEVAHEIVLYIKSLFSDIPIELRCFEYYKDPYNQDLRKGMWHDPEKQKAFQENKMDFMINSLTTNPPDLLIDRSREQNEPRSFRHSMPFAHVNKKFLAHFYKKYELWDLFNMTVSCTKGGYPKIPQPCKDCLWCKEKYWAFGVYDGGVT